MIMVEKLKREAGSELIFTRLDGLIEFLVCL